MDASVKDCIGKKAEDIADALSRYIEMDASNHNVAILKEYLRVALNKELIESQRKYQEDSVKQMQNLVYATWALVIATLLVVAVSSFGAVKYWVINEGKMWKTVGLILNILGIVILAKPDSGWIRCSDKLITKWKISLFKFWGLVISIVGTIILVFSH